MNKLVSIVIPTKKRVPLLKQSLESCLKQTYPDIEVIVVDDGDTDETESFMRSVTDPRVVYVRQPNTGMSRCLSTGFRRSRGEYLSWSSDDDYYALNAIETLAGTLEADPSCDFVYSHYWFVDAQGQTISPARVEGPEGLDRDNYVGHCFMYRRKVYDVTGDYRTQPFLAEDYEYWLRVRANFRMKLIPPMLYYHRRHPDSLTVRHPVEQMQEAVARVRRSFIPFWKHHFLVGERRYHTARRWPAAGHALLSLLVRPWERATWRLLVLSILPAFVVAKIRERG